MEFFKPKTVSGLPPIGWIAPDYFEEVVETKTSSFTKEEFLANYVVWKAWRTCKPFYIDIRKVKTVLVLNKKRKPMFYAFALWDKDEKAYILCHIGFAGLFKVAKGNVKVKEVRAYRISICRMADGNSAIGEYRTRDQKVLAIYAQSPYGRERKLPFEGGSEWEALNWLKQQK